MRDDARAAVAYIAGRLIIGGSASSIYDHAAGRHVSMSGTVTQQNINVYDYGRNCYVRGPRKSLYDYGQSNHIQLKLKGTDGFEGYDYASGRHFSGTVSGSNISLYDHQGSKRIDPLRRCDGSLSGERSRWTAQRSVHIRTFWGLLARCGDDRFGLRSHLHSRERDEGQPCRDPAPQH